MSAASDGKRCLVTGGGTGIGRGIAERLAAQGGVVCVSGRREALLQETCERISQAGGNCHSTVMDVTDPDSVRSAVEQSVTLMGGLDVLVNNAGAGGPNACSGDGPDRWDLIVRTNLDGVFFCCREASRHVTDGGRIVNISSVLGRFGVPGYTAYCASKHGVIGLTKALALELAPRRVTVNAVCPGWVDTELAKDGMERMGEAMGISFEEARDQAMSAVPLGRILQPEEIGDLVVYLASDAASGMTGQAISHCGGQVMW